MFDQAGSIRVDGLVATQKPVVADNIYSFSKLLRETTTNAEKTPAVKLSQYSSVNNHY